MNIFRKIFHWCIGADLQEARENVMHRLRRAAERAPFEPASHWPVVYYTLQAVAYDLGIPFEEIAKVAPKGKILGTETD